MPPAAASPPSPMRIALTVLLDGAKDSRSVFRHLAAVEHDLGRKDGAGRFLFEIPADRLRVVLRQLDGLIGEKPASGLAALRACLVDAIKSREKVEARQQMREPISSFFVDHKMQVSEGSASDFDALHAAWNGAAVAPTTPKA